MTASATTQVISSSSLASSVDTGSAVWLPSLSQLLALLGERFESLTARSGGHVVRLDNGSEHVDVSAEDAAARALLATL